MSDNPYESAMGGRLCFKGGALASRSSGVEKKSKKKKKKDKKKVSEEIGEEQLQGEVMATGDGSGEGVYTIDAAKKMKYEDLFPVETKKFGYDPKETKSNSVEQALNERVKKKADRYCK